MQGVGTGCVGDMHIGNAGWVSSIPSIAWELCMGSGDIWVIPSIGEEHPYLKLFLSFSPRVFSAENASLCPSIASLRLDPSTSDRQSEHKLMLHLGDSLSIGTAPRLPPCDLVLINVVVATPHLWHSTQRAERE